MKVAFGGLRWTPSEFWASTLTEFMAACDGVAEANGTKPDVPAPSRAELDELMAKYA